MLRMRFKRQAGTITIVEQTLKALKTPQSLFKIPTGFQ